MINIQSHIQYLDILVCFYKYQSTNHRPRVNHTIDLNQQGLQITGRGFQTISSDIILGNEMEHNMK